MASRSLCSFLWQTNQYIFYDDETVEVKPVRYNKNVLNKINQSLFLIYLNQKRSASKILKTINFKKVTK